MAKFDIVIPCYNYGRFLKACVESVLSQSQQDVRVLIIDDASSDDSARVAQQLAQEDARVTVNVHRQNLGHIATYNEGIAWACAEYFLLLSADDLLAPGALERAAKVMDDNPDITLTFGFCIDWNDDFPYPLIPSFQELRYNRVDLIRHICLTARNAVPTPTAIVRTTIQKEIGGYSDTLPHAGDMEMWLRFACRGTVAQIFAIQAIYRKHRTAMSNSYWESVIADYEQRRQAFASIRQTCRNAPPDLAANLHLADRELASQALQSAVNFLRRGSIRAGLNLYIWAVILDHYLLYHPPVWRLIRPPGLAGRRWLRSIVQPYINRLTAATSR